VGKVYEIDGVVPVIDPSSFVHPDAVIVGDVIIGADCYIGPCASLRGDFGSIRIRRGVNVQDTCVIHSFPEVEVLVEDNVHIGHGAVIHACTLKRNAFIGMNAVIMDNAVIGENAFVGAMSFVKEGTQVRDNTLVVGAPAKEIRVLTEQEIRWKSTGTYLYQQLVIRSLKTLKPAVPLEVEEPDRKRVNSSKDDIVPLHDMKNKYV